MIRTRYIQEIANELRVQPVCGLTGPRQVGKTTLALQYAEEYHQDDYHVIDLEDPYDIARLENFATLKESLIIIDEIQWRPDLFPILRVIIDKERGLADEKKRKRSFLILGSASQKLLKQSSESLAGRIE